MLDIELLRENPEFVKERLRLRREDYPKLVDEALRLDEKRRSILKELEALRAERNALSKEIGKLKSKGEQTAELDGKEGESTEEDLARALGVRAYPHIIFYNSQGEIILRIPGYTPPKTLTCAIRYVKEEFYKKENINQFLQREGCV